MRESQLFVSVDSGELLEACYQYGVTHRGGGPEFETSETASSSGSKPAGGVPDWKQDYEKAVQRVSADAEAIFRSIPAAAFFGRGAGDGAKLPAVYRPSSAGAGAE